MVNIHPSLLTGIRLKFKEFVQNESIHQNDTDFS